VEEPKQNTCVETHMPVVKYIPHGYRFSKETDDKSKSSCRKRFISFGGLLYNVASTKIACIASNYRTVNELGRILKEAVVVNRGFYPDIFLRRVN
jgi:hypothetical protein